MKPWKISSLSGQILLLKNSKIYANTEKNVCEKFNHGPIVKGRVVNLTTF